MKKNEWVVDLKKRVSIHLPTGLVILYTKAVDEPHAWDGRALNPEVLAAEYHVGTVAARLMRKGGEAYLAEIKKTR